MPDRQVPFGAFNFLVDVNDVTTGGFSDVSGLSTDVDVAEYRNGNDRVNHVTKIPGMHKTGDVTLKRGIINSDDLWAWMNEIRVEGVTAKKNVVITMLSENGTRVQGWKLIGVIPTKYAGPTLAAKGGGDVAMEELTLAADQIEHLP